MDPVLALRSFFVLSSCTIVIVDGIPAFRNRFLLYGSRTTPTRDEKPEVADKSEQDTSTKDAQNANVVERFMDWLATIRVPHAYFMHFYIISVVSSGFWAYQILFHGKLLRLLINSVGSSDETVSMTVEQIGLAWALMAMQGCRRLYECIILYKPSKSKMWFVHWWLGWAFYLAMGVSIWIEGAAALKHADSITFGSLDLSPPSLKTIIGIPIFIMASGIQHDCHVYLASLKKYTLPVAPMFQRLVCPHYFAECLIYFSLSIVAAPQGRFFNRTIFSGLVFVAMNLGATAESTRKWTAEKFGQDTVRNRWRMIPYIF